MALPLFREWRLGFESLPGHSASTPVHSGASLPKVEFSSPKWLTFVTSRCVQKLDSSQADKQYRITDRISTAALFNKSYCGINIWACAQMSSCECVRMVSPYDYENDPDAEGNEEKYRDGPEHDLRPRYLALRGAAHVVLQPALPTRCGVFFTVF